MSQTQTMKPGQSIVSTIIRMANPAFVIIMVFLPVGSLIYAESSLNGQIIPL